MIFWVSMFVVVVLRVMFRKLGLVIFVFVMLFICVSVVVMEVVNLCGFSFNCLLSFSVMFDV